MKYALFLVMLLIFMTMPFVAYAGRKELSDAAKAGIILYGLAQGMFAFIRAMKGLPDL